MNPADTDVRALCDRLTSYDLVIIGTINASQAPGQAALVNALLKRRTPLISHHAMRMPYDIAAYPSSGRL